MIKKSREKFEYPDDDENSFLDEMKRFFHNF